MVYNSDCLRPRLIVTTHAGSQIRANIGVARGDFKGPPACLPKSAYRFHRNNSSAYPTFRWVGWADKAIQELWCSLSGRHAGALY